MKTAALGILLLLTSAARGADLPRWMKGSWSGEIRGVKMEEHWTSPECGLMLSMHRDVKKDGTVSFEFARIEKIKDVMTFMAMPGGRTPTAFTLKSITADRVVFENLEHDFPQRISYWRNGEKLCASVEGTVKNKVESEEWCWGRMKQ